MNKEKPQFRLQMLGESDWLYRLKRVEWAEGMVRLGYLTKADIPQLAKEVRDRYKEFTISKPTADEWIEWAMNKGIEPDAVKLLRRS